MVQINRTKYVNQEKRQEEEANASDSQQVIETPPIKGYNKYTAELWVDENGYLFEGIVQFVYTHQYHKATKKIFIHSPSIKVQDTQINWVTVPFEQTKSSLQIQSPFEIQKDEEVTVMIQFKGELMKHKKLESVALACNFLPTIGLYTEIAGWVQTDQEQRETYGFTAPADYNVTVHTYKDQYPIGTGVLNNVCEKEDIITTSFNANHVRDFGLLLGPKMEREVFNTEKGSAIALYYLPDSHIQEATVPTIKKSLSYYSDLFGEYPYTLLTAIHIEGMGEGLAYPTLIMGDLNKKEDSNGYINKLVGKQWLYYIMGKNKEDYWLSEGLLAYLNRRFYLSQGQLRSYLEEQKKRQFLEDGTMKWTQNEIAVQMFYEIEEKIGTEAWNHVLREYYKKSSFGTGAEKGLIQLIEDVAHFNVSNIHDDWTGKIEKEESDDL